MEDIDKHLAGYAGRQIEDAAAVLRTLRRKGIAPDAFLQWVAAQAETRRKAIAALEEDGRERQRKSQLIQAALRQHAPRCPDCQAQMILHAGDNKDSHWVCRKCRHSVYQPHPPEAELRRIGIKET